MIDSLVDILTLIAALGCGLMAGFFFAFSACVMRALSRLPSAQGIAAMQSINVVVLNRWFLSAFFGTAAVCLVLATSALWMWNEPGAIYRLLASLSYLAGNIGVTAAFNVPRNNALATVKADSVGGTKQWNQFLPSWTAWNHVRTVSALFSAAVFCIALR